MSTSLHLSDIRTRSYAVTLIILVLVSVACFFYLALAREIEPIYLLAVAALIPTLVLAFRRFSLALLAGLLFVGDFKTVPAQGISLSDPTMILLLLVVGALLLNAFFMLTTTSTGLIGEMFKGQATPITLFLIFCGAITLSLLYTQSEMGAMKVARFVTFEVIVFFAPLLLLKNKRDMQQLLLAIVGLGGALAVKVILELTHPSNQVLRGNEDVTRIGESELLGIVLLICLYSPAIKIGIVKFACVIYFLFSVVACAARTAILATIVSMLVSACFTRSGIGMLSRKTVMSGLVLAALVATPAFMWLRNVPAAEGKVSWKTAELESFISGAPIETGTMSSRLDFYQSALHVLAQHPGFGLGVGGWSIFYYDQDALHYPHNMVLEVAAEQGTVGVAILVALLSILFRAGLRLLRYDRNLGFVFPVLVFSLCYHFTTGTVESRELWFVCGLVAAASRLRLSTELQDPASVVKVSPLKTTRQSTQSGNVPATESGW